MAVVIAALLPVFLLIVLGFILKRTPDTAGDAMARAGTADLLRPASGPADPDAGEGRSDQRAGGRSRRRADALGAGDVAVVPCAAAPALPRRIDGPAFTSIFQGATRWQTYVALAVSGNLFGHIGLALASVAMVAIIPLVNVFSVAVLAHYASPEKRSAGSIVMTVVSNPLIWACAIGLALNVTHIPLPRLWHEVADALGRSSLAIGLLVTGAGLHLEGMFRPEPRRQRRGVPQAGPDAGDRASRWRCGLDMPVPTSPS